MKNCRNILKDKFEKYGHTPFPIDELFNAGFDKNVPIVKLRIDENEKEWIKICEFGVFIKSETREVEIIKIK